MLWSFPLCVSFGFPCSSSQSLVPFSVEHFGYNCMCGSVCIYLIISVITSWFAWFPPTRRQKQVTLNKKSTQITQSTFPSTRQKPKGRRNTTIKSGKRRPQVDRVRKKMMRRQRNRAQMKEWGRNSQDQINEEEINNLPEREFRIVIVKVLHPPVLFVCSVRPSPQRDWTSEPKKVSTIAPLCQGGNQTLKRPANRRS